VLLHFVQFQQTVFRNSAVFEISSELFANGYAQFPVQSGEGVQNRLGIVVSRWFLPSSLFCLMVVEFPFLEFQSYTHLLEHVLKLDTTLLSIAHTGKTSRLGVFGEIDCMVTNCYGTTRLAVIG
jgi:hypothetical protein